MSTKNTTEVDGRKTRVSGIVAVAAIAFGAVALILMQVMPGPRTKVDYLVIGTAGTFVALLVLFVLLNRGVGNNLFFRRPKQ